ncbi:MAG: hypothetical protein H5U40_12775, partial [Polyangiaceae bacterium]|nr:hypothetical protein [Polyangiaceae bacterium]
PVVDRTIDELASSTAERIETHISWVLLDGADVYKLKKPVDFGFLDFRTLEQRRAACEAEVRLNARLAPDVYLGVLPVTRGAGGKARLAGDGEIIDYAVHMRRLPDSDRADVRLSEGRLQASDIDRIAERIATFHAAAETNAVIARFGEPRAIERNIDENFVQTRSALPRAIGVEEAAELERRHREFVSHRAPFLERIARGRVRDGHGDLRLEHVYVSDDGSIRVIDCIEFNDRFRYEDVCADVAFLAMDLARSGAPLLAERFLSQYARASQDYDFYPLIDFYESYRAFVRGKVASIRAKDPTASAQMRSRAWDEARRDFLLALSCGRPSIFPASVVAVGGLIASGKSTLAEAIAHALGAPVVD